MAIRQSVGNRLEWYSTIAGLIADDIEGFVAFFFPDVTLKKSGKTYQMQPCPVCGHKDCATIGLDNMIHCFSCDWSGTYINAYIDYAKAEGKTSYEAIKELSDYYEIPYPSDEEGGDAESFYRHQKVQEVLKEAERFYHDILMKTTDKVDYDGTEMTPYEYLTEVRKRKRQTLSDFQVGYTAKKLDLRNNLLAAGYTDEEIKAAKVVTSIPEGVIVYFYHNPTTKDIMRVNTKNPFKVKAVFRNENGEIEKSSEPLKGWSAFDKFLYFPPKFIFKKPVILVEGENDIQSIYEQGFKNVVAFGGKSAADTLDVLNQCAGPIYTMFDNDQTGGEYTELVNTRFPDKIVAKLNYDDAYKDPDEYFKSDSHLSIDELIEKAEPLVTDKYKVDKQGNKWTIKTREKSLEFVLKGKSDRNGQLIGQANLYAQNGKLELRQDDVALVKCKGKMIPLAFYLQDSIEHYLNSNFDNLSIQELIDRYQYSSRKQDIILVIAKRLYESGDESGAMIPDIKKMVKDLPSPDKIMDSILIEYNNLKNESLIKDGKIIPKIKIAQYYNLLNNDAYFYFTYRKDDGDAKRAIPYLLKNDKSLIRLDLLKRKDQQCLLLVDNKYELPFEVPTAVFDTLSCSLQDTMIEDFREDKLDPESIKPHVLIKEIETWIRKFYYSKDDNIYKVLALWCYGTYFYIMFSQYPYLYVNGEKGSGKTALNNTLSMFAFNARVIVDASEAALFRGAGVEGGTMILDEQENMTSRTSSIATPTGAILKSGYTSSAYVSRYNLEKGVTESFDTFCPKVISNIFGLEDIILDRCLPINSYQVKISKDLNLEDPKYYIENDQEPYKNITSRCCFSALTHFQALNAIYRDKNNRFESGNARLTQILTPIYAVAKFADKEEAAERAAATGVSANMIIGEYEKAFTEYYNTTIQYYKSDVDKTTPEGIVKNIVSQVANELTGNVKDGERDYTIIGNRKYNEPIAYNLEEGWFEINAMHFKCFIEESLPGDQIYIRIVPKWLKTCFKFNESDIRRKTITLENDDLIKEMKGIAKPKVNVYKFYFKDFIKSDFLSEQKEIKAEKVEIF